MRIRRRLHGKRRARRPGMKGDWVVLAHTDCPVQLHDAQNCQPDEFTAANVDVFTLLDGGDLREKEDALTIVRQVGEIGVLWKVHLTTGTTSSASLSICQINEHIVIGTTDDTGAVAVLDPRRDVTMESDCILWRRRSFVTMALPASGAGGFCSVDEDTHEYASGHLDLRVKRRLTQGTELFYAVGITEIHSLGPLQQTDLASPFLVADLRGYVKF